MVLRQPLLNVADGALERDVEAERRVLVMRTLDHQRHFVGVHRYDRSEDRSGDSVAVAKEPLEPNFSDKRKEVWVNDLGYMY